MQKVEYVDQGFTVDIFMSLARDSRIFLCVFRCKMFAPRRVCLDGSRHAVVHHVGFAILACMGAPVNNMVLLGSCQTHGVVLASAVLQQQHNANHRARPPQGLVV